MALECIKAKKLKIAKKVKTRQSPSVHMGASKSFRVSVKEMHPIHSKLLLRSEKLNALTLIPICNKPCTCADYILYIYIYVHGTLRKIPYRP